MGNSSKSTKFGSTFKNNGNAADGKGVVSRGAGVKIDKGGMQPDKGSRNQKISNSDRIKWN